MRFFTVKDAKTARSSVIYAVWIIGIFYVLTIFLGFGAANFVGADAIIAENAAGNMAAPMLAGVLRWKCIGVICMQQLRLRRF